MKTILNHKSKSQTIQVPAAYLFSHSGYHFFIHRQVIDVYANGTAELSEKTWAVSEYTTGVAMKQHMTKKAAKGECIDLLNSLNPDRIPDSVGRHEVINFNLHEVLSFVEKQVPAPAKNLILGKYALSAADIATAELEYNAAKQIECFKNALADVKMWIKFANEVVMLPGYVATAGRCEKHNCMMIEITHDKGSYKMPTDDIGILHRAMMEAFNVDGAGEHLKAGVITRKKKDKPVKAVAIAPEVQTEAPVTPPEYQEQQPGDLIAFTAPAAPATWTTHCGLSIELPAGYTRENLPGITYTAPARENSMYVDKAGILWEFTPGWKINEIISTHNKKQDSNAQRLSSIPICGIEQHRKRKHRAFNEGISSDKSNAGHLCKQTPT